MAEISKYETEMITWLDETGLMKLAVINVTTQERGAIVCEF